MGDEEKKPDAQPEPQPGFPQKKILYAVLAIAVVILAVVLIAKFGYNTDLLNPAGGQMSLVQHPATLVRPDVTTSGQQPRLEITPAFQRVITDIPRVSPCAVNQSDDCNGACVYLQTDPNNCGSCGKACPAYAHADKVCSGGQCVFTCSAGRGDCNNQKASDGCETCLRNDNNNCGRCGVQCATGGTSCFAGSCVSQLIIYKLNNGDLAYETSCD
jgi:hypothetical protein